MVELARNQWPVPAGIGGRFETESVVGFKRNTQANLLSGMTDTSLAAK